MPADRTHEIREPAIVVFGPFEFDPRARALRREGGEVALGRQATDLLVAFAERPGQLVTHGELSERLWPGAGADDSAVRVYVSALRRALGDGFDGARYIVNEHGRGYRFVGSVAGRPSSPSAPAPAPPGRFALPAPAAGLIGREALIAEIVAALATHRLVTLVGPGGIGKTRSALAAATVLQQTGVDARFVDLGPVADHAAAAALVAAALDLRGDRRPARTPTCLVLDNCEHLLPALSPCLDRLLEGLPALRLLATSRAPTHASGEHVVGLAGLDCPSGDEASSVAAASHSPAVRLFLERTAMASPHFRIDETNVADISGLCRRLDGVPLALELAAGWIRLVAVEDIARGVDGRLLALSGGQSAGPARHRTLEAVLDWSYDLLPEAEQDALCRVSVFQGAFTAEAALRVLELSDGATARAALAPLVEKSLVAKDGDAFRLLDVTRAYARRRFDRRPWSARVRALHARVCIDDLETADADLLTLDRAVWSRTYGPMTGDVSAALGWCFSPAGDAALGAELAARSAQIALQSGLGAEFRRHFAAALARADGDAQGRGVARLRFAYAMMRADETGTSDPFLLDLPERDGAPDRQAASPEAGAALFSAAYLDGDYPAAARHAEALARQGRAEGERGVALAGARMLAQALHHLGRHRDAERLARAVVRSPLHFLPLTNVPQRVSMRIILARIAFLDDRLSEARALAAEALAAARESNGPSVCQALTQARIPLAVWTGDGDAAAADIELLRTTAHDLRLQYWIVWLEGLEMALASLDADPGGRGQLQFALSLRRLPTKLADQLATFDPSLLTPETAGRVAAGTVGWCAPEVLRVEARRAADPCERRALLRRAAARAAEQGAVAWSRRIEADLVRSETRPVRLHET